MDARLRELHAAWKASRSPADQAAWLRAAVRAGAVDAAALRVGVWLGDEVAREVGRELLGDDAVTLVAPKSGVNHLLLGLPGGPAVRARAAHAALCAAIALRPPQPVIAQALQAAAACLEPTPDRRAAAREAADDVQALHGAFDPTLERALSVLLDELARGDPTSSDALVWRLGDCEGPGVERAMRAAVVAALLPWVYESALAADATPAPASELALFSPATMTGAAAAAILEYATRLPGRLRPEQACLLLEAYFLALGWRVAKDTFYDPARPVRVKLNKRTLRIEVGAGGEWRRPSEHHERDIGVVDVATRLIEIARAHRRPDD